MPLGSGCTFNSKNPPSANRTGLNDCVVLGGLRPLQSPLVLQYNFQTAQHSVTESTTKTTPREVKVVEQQLSMQQQHQQQQLGCHSKNNTNIVYPCCVPTGCSVNGLITQSDITCDAIRVICSNRECNRGSFMHKICFDLWELNVVLKQLALSGPARSWSDKQRQQNVWKKG